MSHSRGFITLPFGYRASDDPSQLVGDGSIGRNTPFFGPGLLEQYVGAVRWLDAAWASSDTPFLARRIMPVFVNLLEGYAPDWAAGSREIGTSGSGVGETGRPISPTLIECGVAGACLSFRQLLRSCLTMRIAVTPSRIAVTPSRITAAGNHVDVLADRERLAIAHRAS